MNHLPTIVNAADKAAIIEQALETLDESLAFQMSATKVSGVANTLKGPPTTGAWLAGRLWVDSLVGVWLCTAAGTPGTWVQKTPASVSEFPETPVDGYRVQRTDRNFQTYRYVEADNEWLMEDVTPSDIAALEIDWSAARVHTKTLAANTTFTFAGSHDGQSIIVAVTNTENDYSVTWPAEVIWPAGATPVQTIGEKTDIYTFQRIGAVIYGSVVQDYIVPA